jgi:hypothetical protein
MHIHDYRSRVLVGHAAQSITIGRFRCADRASCGAVVQVLPVFVARGLWRAWETVETVAFESGVGDTEPNVVEVPERTQRRWRARLATSAALLVTIFAAAADTWASFASIVARVGLGGRRAELVSAHVTVTKPPLTGGLRLGSLAAVLHRLAPGVRLM